MPRPLVPMLYVVEVHPEDGVLRYSGDIEVVNERHKIKVEGYLSVVVLWLRKTEAVFDETEPVVWRGEAPPGVIVLRNSPHQVSIVVTGLLVPTAGMKQGPFGFRSTVRYRDRPVPGPDPTVINVDPPYPTPE